MEKTIYLDMDGVCCDFPSMAIRAHGGDPEEVFDAWKRDHGGKWENYDVMGLPENRFWQVMNHQEEAFWQNLPEYSWFRELYDNLEQKAPVIFLSSAGSCPGALSGKLRWLKDRFGEGFCNYIFTIHKYHLAREGRVLVDDYELYVRNFRQAGGKAVLFPQIWGPNHHITDKVGFVLKKVHEYLDSVPVNKSI